MEWRMRNSSGLSLVRGKAIVVAPLASLAGEDEGGATVTGLMERKGPGS
jgi:hypothetical protein